MVFGFLIDPNKKKSDFDYYAIPDGEQIFPKLGHVLKPVAGIAFAASSLDVLLYSKPRTTTRILSRYFIISAPIIGGSIAFVLGSNLAGTIRKKSDQWNWFAGGAFAGSIFGAWTNNIQVGILVGVGLGTLAAIRRYGVSVGHDWMPDVHQQVGTAWVNSDWTLTKDRPGNWTTGK